MSSVTPSNLRSSQPPAALAVSQRVDEPGESSPPGGALLEELALTLDHQQIGYCQWKGHWSAHRWRRGYGNVDLLVDRAALPAFQLVAGQLGFKLAHPAGERQIPGIEHYLGFDPSTPRLLHLHVHYRLLLGEYWKRVYRLPIERQILEQSRPGEPFRVPSPTHCFLIFVLRMMLRQIGRPLLSADDRWLSGIKVPLASLEAASDPEELARLLTHHLYPIDSPFINRCVRSLQGESGTLDRLVLPWELHLRLRAHVRRPTVSAMVTAGLEKVLPTAAAQRVVDPSLRLSAGGLVLALIEGQGTSKSTCARALHGWLAPDLPTMRAHLGHPPKSLLTLLVGVALRLERGANQLLRRTQRWGSHLEAFLHFCTARDRYRLYQKVRRFGISGGIAVCEHYPMGGQTIDAEAVPPGASPAAPGWLADQLRRAAARYHNRILAPDAVFVLEVDPELAVARKAEEPADCARTPGWLRGPDSSTARGYLIDAAQPLPDLLRQLQTTLWPIL